MTTAAVAEELRMRPMITTLITKQWQPGLSTTSSKHTKRYCLFSTV